MLVRIAAAVGIAFALATVLFALRGHSGRANFASVARVGFLSLGAAAWLGLASTALLWVFPINVVASAYIGFYATRRALKAFQPLEVKAFAMLSFAAGAAIAAAIATKGDAFLLQVAAPYSLLNAAAMAIAALIALRSSRSVA